MRACLDVTLRMEPLTTSSGTLTGFTLAITKLCAVMEMAIDMSVNRVMPRLDLHVLV